MEMRQLGRTDVQVSKFCLGSMTWGTQNTEDEGHLQIDTALDYGVNFIDTAELYPTNPLSSETQGRTEEILGTWLQKSGRRDDVIIATKIVGEGNKTVRGRDGADITPETIRTAVETSLQRLKTDYIDLYQFHWPNRGSYHFRKNWGYAPAKRDPQAIRDDMRACLETVGELVNEGKIRHFGTSNESAWGVSQFLRLSEDHNLPRMVSIQNEYSLLCRLYDLDLGELSIYEDVGLLAYSPLAAGILSGKYQGHQTPALSRRSINHDLGGRITDHVYPAVDTYLAIAEKHGLDPVQMSLAWAASRPFMASVIFGARTQEQLVKILEGADLELSDEVMQEIEAAHRKHPLPI